jgi:hypothetical protein
MNEIFYSSRLKNPFLPNEIHLSDKGINFKTRNLFSSTENFVLYHDIAGVEIDKGLFFANIRIKARAREQEIQIDNFSKSDASSIKKLILDRV